MEQATLRDETALRRARRRVAGGLAVLGAALAVRIHGEHARAPEAQARSIVYSLPVEVNLPHSKSCEIGGLLGELSVEVPPGRASLVVRLLAGGDFCPSAEGVPHVEVSLDGRGVATFAVDAPRDRPRAFASGPIPAGPGVHRLGVSFLDDVYRGPGCDRNVVVRAIHVAAP